MRRGGENERKNKGWKGRMGKRRSVKYSCLPLVLASLTLESCFICSPSARVITHSGKDDKDGQSLLLLDTQREREGRGREGAERESEGREGEGGEREGETEGEREGEGGREG